MEIPRWQQLGLIEAFREAVKNLQTLRISHDVGDITGIQGTVGTVVQITGPGRYEVHMPSGEHVEISSGSLVVSPEMVTGASIDGTVVTVFPYAYEQALIDAVTNFLSSEQGSGLSSSFSPEDREIAVSDERDMKFGFLDGNQADDGGSVSNKRALQTSEFLAQFDRTELVGISGEKGARLRAPAVRKLREEIAATRKFLGLQ